MDAVIEQAREELRAAGIPAGQVHDLRAETIERANLMSIAPDPVTVRAYLADPRMPSHQAQRTS